jgi:hypothetical protein
LGTIGGDVEDVVADDEDDDDDEDEEVEEVELDEYMGKLRRIGLE